MKYFLLLICFIFTLQNLSFANNICKERIYLIFTDSCKVSDTIIRLENIATLNGADNVISKIKTTVIGENAPCGYFRYVNSNEVLNFILKQKYPEVCFICNKEKRIKVFATYKEIIIGNYEEDIKNYIYSNVDWNKENVVISLKNKEEKIKCLDLPFNITISGLKNKYPKGNLNLKLTVSQGGKTFSAPVLCFVSVVAPVVVSSQTIKRGEMLTKENCKLKNIDITNLAYMPITKLEDLENLISTRTILSGIVIHDKNTTKIPDIKKDDMVFLEIKRKNICISLAVRARENGVIGNKIWVENETSKKLLRALIIGKGKVKLLQGDDAI
jgi:flagella basal body P-ring formation protein FlgA